jgi:hypothetical protein
MADIEILPVPVNAVRVVWDKALPHLAEPIALSHGCYEPEDVAGFCEKGGFKLWLACDGEEIIAAIVAEIVDFPRKRVLLIRFAGGRDMARWYAPMETAVEEWARAFGCSAECVFGRKGWARVTRGNEAGVVVWRDFAAGPAAPASAEVH